MEIEIAAPTEADVLSPVVPRIAERRKISALTSIEHWLDANLTLVAIVVVIAGFGVRLLVASRSFLNPDEAIHFLLINQSSLVRVYKTSLGVESHPPLLYALMYFWHFLGRSEVVLRLPSVFAGTAFCWMSFEWMKEFFSRATSLIGLILVTFSPALINLSAEIRQYSLLLFCMGAALYFLGRAFSEKTPGLMWCFSSFLYLAILSHYSAAFFVGAMGVYTLARIADAQLPRKVVVTWAIGQAGALTIYISLYLFHLSKIKDNIARWSIPFETYFFHWQDGDLFFFLRQNTSDFFRYLFKQQLVSDTVLFSYLAGVALMFFKALRPSQTSRHSSHLGILLSLPFLAVWGGSIAHIYPYLGSRHIVFLAPFAIAAASSLIATIVRQKIWAGLVIASLLAGVANASEDPSRARITKQNQRRELMSAAMEYVHRAVPTNEPIFGDLQSGFELGYYLCTSTQRFKFFRTFIENFQISCGGYTIFVSTLWKLHADNFASNFQKMAQMQGLKPGDRAWIFQAGWGRNLDSELPASQREFRCIGHTSFGANITVIPFIAGPALLPAAATTCGTDAPAAPAP